MTTNDELVAELEAGLAGERAQIQRLAINRGWLAVDEHARKHQARLRDRIVNAMFRRGAKPVDQRDVDYTRGWVDAIDWFLGLPTKMRGEE